MKVKHNRHGQTLRRTICARVVWLAGVTLLIAAAPAPAYAQSAGMAHLLHPKSQSPGGEGGSQPQPERPRQAPRRAESAERDMAERATRQGQRGGSQRLSPDERKSLRKNLYDIGKEMYQGG